MINWALYHYEMKRSIKLLFIFTAILTLYISIIMTMYDSESMKALDSFYETMPEIMDAVGMTIASGSMIDFMISFLYGFILLAFPMVYSIIRGYGLIGRYVDDSSIVPLLAALVKRSTIAKTQLFVLLTGVVFLVAYTTGLEIFIGKTWYPNDFKVIDILKVNGGLLGLHLLIAGICFLGSAFFSDGKKGLAFSAGISSLMFVLNMLANAGKNTEYFKDFTFFYLV